MLGKKRLQMAFCLQNKQIRSFCFGLILWPLEETNGGSIILYQSRLYMIAVGVVGTQILVKLKIKETT